MSIKTKLFEHQKEGFERFKDEPYGALFFECGLGKTLTAIAIIDYRKARKPGYKTLVVCPNTIVENWKDEVEMHTDMSSLPLVGTKQRRTKILKETSDVYIINYESARILYKELIDKEFDCVVLDESTAVKNPKSLQSKACYDICRVSRDKLILTGTPIMNNPLDMFGQYRCLNINIFGPSFYAFRHRYAIMGGYMQYQVVQWINMEEFRQRVGACALRKTKEECLDLPDKLYQTVRLDLPQEQDKVYKALKTQFLAEFNESVITAPVVITRLMRFSQITAGFTKDVTGEEHGFTKNPKVDWLLDFLHNLEAGGKVIVFCRFLYELKSLCKALGDNNIGFVEVYGATTDRIERIKSFNTSPDIKVFVGQLQTTSLGVNLTSAQYAIFFSNSYSYGMRVQAEDRIHRIGQSKNVTYIDLVMRGTIDEGIHTTLKNKQSLSNMVVGALKELP